MDSKYIVGGIVGVILGVGFGGVAGSKMGEMRVRSELKSKLAAVDKTLEADHEKLEVLMYTDQRMEALNKLEFAEFRLAMLRAPLAERERIGKVYTENLQRKLSEYAQERRLAEKAITK